MSNDLEHAVPNAGPYVLDISLDRNSGVPLHSQISKPLAKLITSGQLRANTLIEDEVSMAKRLSVSRPTTRRALQDLVGRGLLSRKRGIGTHVTPRQVHRQMGLTSLKSDLEESGFETHTEILAYELILAGPDEQRTFNCEEGAEIVRVERLRSADGKPIALLTNFLLAEFAPSLTDLSNRGLYDCLREAGIQLATANHHVRARNATEREADLLQMPDKSAVLTMTQTVFDVNGKTAEFGSHIYNPELYQLSFTSTAD